MSRRDWPKVLDIPWHVRARCALRGMVDRLAVRLIKRDRQELARRLWRATGLWR